MTSIARPRSVSVPLVAVVLSCLFSLIRIFDNPLLNDDAYSYLRAAGLFNTDGASAVLDNYGWYGYSILIALGDRVLPGGLVASAHILNTACYALLVWLFIDICTWCYGAAPSHGTTRDRQRLQLFSALVILAFPLINEMRYFLIRDSAYWAFALLSLLHLLRFNSNGRLRNAIYWSMALMAAIAFRLEGLLVAILTPLAVVLARPTGGYRDRLVRFGKLLGVLLALLLMVFALALVAGVNLFDLARFAYRFYLPQLYDLGTLVKTTALAVNEPLFTLNNFPGNDNVVHGIVIVFFAYCFTVLNNLVEAFSVPLTLLATYALWRGHVRVPASMRAPFVAYLAASLLALLIFLFIMHFQTQRYAAFACILLLLLLPDALNDMYRRAEANNALKRFVAAIAVLYVYLFTDSLVSFGHSQAHLEQAIAWSLNSLPADGQLQTNNFAVAYHSRAIENFDRISLDAAEVLQQSSAGDYLILDIGHDDVMIRSQLDSNPRLQLLDRFANERGDEARVYLQRQIESE